MLLNPKLYEINTRVWIKQFDTDLKLLDIPVEKWNSLAKKGIDIIWLLGVWETCPGLIKKCCFTSDLTSSYSRSLNDWTSGDVIGSPFAINNYNVNSRFGCMDDLKQLKSVLNKIGLKLFLDFIPNHFSAGSELLKSNPEIFLRGDKELFENDPFTFFKLDESEYYFAHGRDPLFPAWTDTAQVNYFSEEAREFMLNSLLKLADVCDGVRCDMAMLSLNNVFENTWLGVLNKTEFVKPEKEFWETAIKKVKQKSPEFIFMAETYWDLEWELQQLGFDFTYDKRLTDRLAAEDLSGVKTHLLADKEYQLKSVRFLENHDENRAVTKFGKKQSYAGAVLMSTIQGMKLYYDGQFEGKKIRLPLQLGREPVEKVSRSMQAHYDKILNITKAEIFKSGEWTLLEPLPVSETDLTSEYIFAWRWKLKNENRIIVINYSENNAYCRLKFQLDTKSGTLNMHDLFNDINYPRSVEEIRKLGLFIELKCFHCHIFSFFE